MKATGITLGLSLVIVLLVSIGYSQIADPILSYEPPANFFKISGAGSPEVFTSSEVNATVAMYQFRAFNGNITAQFQQTLLRDWIDPLYRETNISSRPDFRNSTLPNGTVMLVARFTENTGMPKVHVRTIYVVNRAAAIVDITAASEYAMQRVQPSLWTMFQSLSVTAGGGGASVPGNASGPERAMAGIYQGIKSHYNTDLFGSSSSGYFDHRPYYYLLSPDGRFYRTFDIVMVQKTDALHFNYAAAAATDPENSGIFHVQGNRLLIQARRGGQVQTGVIESAQSFTLEGVTYSRN